MPQDVMTLIDRAEHLIETARSNRVQSPGKAANAVDGVSGVLGQLRKAVEQPSLPEINLDEVARDVHERWRASADRSYSPLNVPWDELSPEQRADSRNQCRGVLDAVQKNAGRMLGIVVHDVGESLPETETPAEPSAPAQPDNGDPAGTVTASSGDDAQTTSQNTNSDGTDDNQPGQNETTQPGGEQNPPVVTSPAEIAEAVNQPSEADKLRPAGATPAP